MAKRHLNSTQAGEQWGAHPHSYCVGLKVCEGEGDDPLWTHLLLSSSLPKQCGQCPLVITQSRSLDVRHSALILHQVHYILSITQILAYLSFP